MIKHTPGPWSVDTAASHFEIRANCDLEGERWYIASVHTNVNDIKNPGESEANARLIAAAPYMFELLEQALLDGDLSSTWSQIETLIQQIKGNE